MAGAAHLKVHVTTNHLRHHHSHTHNLHHDKRLYPDSDGPFHAPEYLRAFFGPVFAVCVFDHQDSRFNSIELFDQDGKLIDVICEDQRRVVMDDIAAVTNNPEAWRTDEIDAQSVCYIHENEAIQDATVLMKSYEC